jgi:hypothetical protein
VENSNLRAAATTSPYLFSPSINIFHFFFTASSQLIVHSSKVRTPQRHNSESVLYMNDEGKMNGTNNNSTEDLSNESFQHRSSRSDNRLFPINTYTEPQLSMSLSASTTSLDAK